MSTKKIVVLGVLAFIVLLIIVIIACKVTGLSLETIIKPLIVPTTPMLSRFFSIR